MSKKFTARKVAKIVDGCHHCPFISEYGIRGTKFSNVKCDVLNKSLPKYGSILKNCPLPNFHGRHQILSKEQQDGLKYAGTPVSYS